MAGVQARLDRIDGRHLRDLLQSEGWKLIQARIYRIASDDLRAFRQAKDMEAVAKLQGRLDMIDRLVNIPSDMLKEIPPALPGEDDEL